MTQCAPQLDTAGLGDAARDVARVKRVALFAGLGNANPWPFFERTKRAGQSIPDRTVNATTEPPGTYLAQLLLLERLMLQPLADSSSKWNTFCAGGDFFRDGLACFAVVSGLINWMRGKQAGTAVSVIHKEDIAGNPDAERVANTMLAFVERMGRFKDTAHDADDHRRELVQRRLDQVKMEFADRAIRLQSGSK